MSFPPYPTQGGEPYGPGDHRYPIIQWLESILTGGAASFGRVGIWAIGDSHIQGHLDTVVVAGSEVLGFWPINGARDRSWNGSADRAFFPANDGIGVTTNSTDANVGSTGLASFLHLLPPSLRQGYPAFNVLRIANCGVGGSSTYTWAGQQADGFLLASAPPTAGDTATVGSVVYTWRAAASIANEVTIGGSATSSMVNLCNAINAENAGFGAGTVVNPQAFCPNVPGTGQLRISALTPGVAGNSLALSATGTAVTVLQAFAQGAALPAGMYADNKALIPAGFGSVDVVLIGLGTNDAARLGYRGRGTQVAMAALVAQVHADFPAAKIIAWRPPASGAGGLTASSLTGTVVPGIDAVVAANPAFMSSIDVNGLGAGTAPFGILGNDGVHLSPYGYAVAAQLFARAIITALGG